ncbi:fungal-specific transcription factor domain-containing protein [Podospora appendiculata]|uniref:Fungal-specific transcription factor domain-containing protein n=1 Tax=Podospora appendiculata TaxID=314037 RepID=A0AAE0X3D5_9PEZI|nr:fungal-specific transcription factor domain-containing protein [Podospora appendiculata]
MSEPSDRGSDESSPPPTESGERDRDRGEGEGDGDRPPPRKRQRIRLSCLECRRRKLSCDREFPCSRCFQSGTPELCEYETRPGLAPLNKLGLSHNSLSNFDSRLSLPFGGGDSTYHRKDIRETDRIRRLELEVAQLKGLLEKQIPSDGSTVVGHSPNVQDVQKPGANAVADVAMPPFLQCQDTGADKELRFFRGKEFKTRYFGPHNAFLAFSELTGLCPFMQETSAEWLRPLHIHNNKDRSKLADQRQARFEEPDPVLESLLPSREETDSLVSIYLDQFEQVHRIVHVPSFRREYAKFWDPAEKRNAAFTALILSIMGISSCLDAHSPHKFDKMVSNSHASALKWVESADEWQSRQSQKHRRLIHYQIACLIYLAKRINTIKKKRFWKGAGALTQDAVTVGLHREPSHISHKISPFNQEMRRRIWATIQSYDLQASFDHGLPTLLSSLHYDVNQPRNIDDDEFDEDTKELPPSKPPSEYTFSSYQHLSRQSLSLRLELSKVLTGPPEELDYDRVIRYTNDLNQEIDSLPSWDVSNNGGGSVLKKPLLAYTLLHIQLRQYIIPLHQPFLRLRKTNSKYQYSEIIYYNAARDMVLLNDKLAQQGIRTLNFLREDNLTLAINLCSVTMLQPRGSTNMIMINSQHTLQLLEKCLIMKEDRILRCGNNDPWGYSIMCASFGLLEAHLGTKTPEAAKAASAERFINLHYKLLACQDRSNGNQPSQPADSGDKCPSAIPYPTVPSLEKFQIQAAPPFPPSSSQLGPPAQPLPIGCPVEIPATQWWPPNTDPSLLSQMQSINPDFNLEFLGLNVNELWGGDSWDWDQT